MLRLHLAPGIYCSVPDAASIDKFVMAKLTGRAATASERAVHKDAIDPVLDELHTRVFNEIQRATAFWSKKKKQFLNEIQQAARTIGKVIAQKETEPEQKLFNDCDSLCKFLKEVQLDVHVNGQHRSEIVLEKCLRMCRELSEWINDIDNGLEYVRHVGHVDVGA